ncbi:MAG: DeoR/GlpR transcriptional regulator [Calditrichaeota bacterium]|nr:DeoR/GlpR transcriptional regulator [Calditrichota bacterium]
MTIRRDLQILEKQGLVKRVHGGAIRYQSLFTGLALSEKEKIRTEEKERIAQYAVGFVKRGDVIIVDSGSTTLRFVRHLKNKSGITVITNALNVASELSKSNNKIILTGGEMERDSLTLLGPLADKTIQSIAADKLFMGIDSIDFENGLTTPSVSEARTIYEMIKASRERILLADSSKFGRRSLAVVNDITVLDKIITDRELGKSDIQKLEQAGIEVFVV